MENNPTENMVEVYLSHKDDFLKVRETLQRIGVASPRKKTLTQTCHILHKRGRYYIAHFKELFLLDGKSSNINEDDIARRNTIVNRLVEWDLVSIDNDVVLSPTLTSMKSIKVVPYREKHLWTMVSKYTLGKSDG